MTDKLKQIIKEELVKLPKESQEVINTFGWEKVSEEIGKKYLLNENEINSLQVEIAMVLLGVTEEDILSINIENRVGTSKNEAEKITAEINQKIFEPMLEKRDSLVKIIPEAKPVNLPVLDSRFSGLPKQVQTAITSSNWRETLYSLAPKYKLTIEQMGILEEITVKVMLNTIHSNSYESELASKITISKEDISNLVKEINENIFKKIRGFEESSKEYVASSMVGESSKEKVVSSKEEKNTEEEVPLPPYGTSSKEYVVGSMVSNSSKDEKILNTNTSQNNVQDILKKIEPIKPVEQIIPTTKIQTPAPNQNTPVPQQPTPSVRSIIEEKLMGSTVSDSTTTDYSNPKTHDPYREAF